MTGGYVYTLHIWPSLLTTTLLVLLSLYAWRRRSVPGSLPFAAGALFSALWALGAGLEVAAVDVTSKVFWLKFQAAWQLPATTSITWFVLEYTWPRRWLNRRTVALFSLVPLLYLALILTNELHHLSWRGFAFEDVLLPLRGPATWFAIAYGYGLSLLNLLLFGWLFLRSPPHRLPVAIIVVGQVGARVLYLLEATNRIHSGLPLDVLMLAYLFLVYGIVLFGLRIFAPVHLARQMVIAQMREGMLVLDPEGRVASANPAAAGILGVPAKEIVGRMLQEVLPACTSIAGDLKAADAGQTEICQERGAERLYYSVEAVVLQDWRGLEAGRLLLLHDVTGQKRVQSELIEQQRTRATLRERERLARELHDSLGQTLAATHLQASTARLLLAQGETTQADRCLEEVAQLTVTAEADVRDYLLGAKIVFSADRAFFPALCLYLRRFGQQYGLSITLKVPPALEAAGLAPAVEVQLMRIIQEALSNIRKHARAETVQVEFLGSRSQLQVVICDDGLGFDPEVVTAQADGFGLQAMRERAEEIGGCLLVLSRPRDGTQVVVQVPGNGVHSEGL